MGAMTANADFQPRRNRRKEGHVVWWEPKLWKPRRLLESVKARAQALQEEEAGRSSRGRVR